MLLNSIKNITTTTLASIMLFSQSLLAAQALPEFNAKYGIEKFGIKAAEATYQLSYTDKGYKFVQNTKLTGIAKVFNSSTVSAVSYVDKVGDNLLLTNYEYVRTGSKKDRDEKLSILWNTHKNMLRGEITGTVRGKKVKLTTDSEIWEILSFQIPLMIEANQTVKEYPYKALLKGEINTYNFVLSATKKIRFAGKPYQAIELVRTDPHKDRQLRIWLIPKLHNIPVIIENHKDGDLDSLMRLERVQFNSEKPFIDDTDNDDDDY